MDKAVEDQGASSRVVADIAAERQRQIDSEGWAPEHDDAHSNGDLATAAACYVAPDSVFWPTAEHWRRGVPADITTLTWPWHREWWKPKDRRRDLIRAAALIVAEIERLDRAQPPVSHD